MKNFLFIIIILAALATFGESLMFVRDITKKVREHHPCDTSSNLLGEWKNELKSLMTITGVFEDPLDAYNNSFTGTYESGVGDAAGPYPLHGTYNYRNCTTSVSFNVIYSNLLVDSGSNTAWVGQLRCINQTLVLETTWIMNKFTPDGSIWRSTMTGHNVFYKRQGGECFFGPETENSGPVKLPPMHHTSEFQEKVKNEKEKIKAIEGTLLEKAETIVLY